MKRALLYLVLCTALATMLFPLWYMIAGALSSNPTAPPEPGDLFLSTPRWSNFVEAWSVSGFPRAVFNSIFVAVVVTLSNLLFGLCTGYALARGKSRWLMKSLSIYGKARRWVS